MSGLNAFAINIEKEELGIWENVGDMEFLIAKAGNDEWRKLHKKLELAAFGNNRNKKKDPEKEVEIITKCLAYTSVLDWREVTLDGKEVKYSKEKCFEILSNKRFKLLTEELLEMALNQERFKEDMIVEDEKK